jgi:hypothetical protein
MYIHWNISFLRTFSWNAMGRYNGNISKRGPHQMVMGNRGNVPIRLSNVAMEHDPFMDVPMKNHEHLYKGGESSHCHLWLLEGIFFIRYQYVEITIMWVVDYLLYNPHLSLWLQPTCIIINWMIIQFPSINSMFHTSCSLTLPMFLAANLKFCTCWSCSVVSSCETHCCYSSVWYGIWV